MKLNFKKWFKSMLWYLLAFVLLGIAMTIAGYWKLFSHEMLMLLVLGFAVSGILNATTLFGNDNFNE